jgi:dTDP-4-dehydrorhamnose 3,5-epimerase-like enzyme
MATLRHMGARAGREMALSRPGEIRILRAMNDLWRGITGSARERLTQRDYHADGVEERIATTGLEGGQALAAESALREAGAWIPGVEIFHRVIHTQRQRGMFGEFAREGEGALGRIGFWPRQWACARMFSGTGKGFHIHPPFVPADEEPAAWFAKLFATGDEENFSLRAYDREQWDVMFAVQGRVEMFLVDERPGFPRRKMRFMIDGDEHRGANTVGVVIPPGVAHAVRTEGSTDVIMVYGTSTVFAPENEGRIASGIESASLPPEWDDYFG